MDKTAGKAARTALHHPLQLVGGGVWWASGDG